MTAVVPAAATPGTATVDMLDDSPSLAHILFRFEGRLPRKAFWLYGVLGPLLASVMLEMLLGIVGVSARRSEVATSLLLVWPCVAVAVKRWHDRDKSGWWVLLNLVPVVGLVWTLIENGLRRGTPGPNRFGAETREVY